MSDFKDVFSRAKKTVVRKTDELSKLAKLLVEIESCKSRLTAIYEKIGECIVTDSLSSGKLDNDKIVGMIAEAKTQRETLKELMRKKKALGEKAECPNCGKSVKKGSFCSSCGEKVQ